jgi:hypothetical protein
MRVRNNQGLKAKYHHSEVFDFIGDAFCNPYCRRVIFRAAQYYRYVLKTRFEHLKVRYTGTVCQFAVYQEFNTIVNEGEQKVEQTVSILSVLRKTSTEVCHIHCFIFL